jgi:glycosyltransferase involved in cell wall biosynthesis
MHWVTRSLYERLQRWALNNAHFTLRCSTRKSCEALISHYGRAVKPSFIVNPAGIDLPADEPKEKSDQVRLLAVGQLIHRKGLDIAIHALEGLRRYPWVLDIVGHGELRQTLEEQVKSLGLAERIRFHGFQPNPGEWYKKADLLLFPSRSESLGLVLLEAMSHGVPCLGFRADGKSFCNVNEELIDHEHTGLLANDTSDFREQLESVFRRSERLGLMGRRAREHVAQHFVWDKHLDRYEELFEQLVPGRTAGTPALAGAMGG